MDWEPTHTRKRKAEWYYSIDPKQRRLNPSQEREEHEKRIYQFLSNQADVHLKLIELIQWNEFDIFKDYLPEVISTTEYLIGPHRFSFYRTILESDNKKFYDELIKRSVANNALFLYTVLNPPNLDLFKKLEGYGDLMINESVLMTVIKHCIGTEILKYLLERYDYKGSYNRAMGIVIQSGCVDNFKILFNYMIKHNIWDIKLLPSIKLSLRHFPNDDMLLEVLNFERSLFRDYMLNGSKTIMGKKQDLEKMKAIYQGTIKTKP